MLIPVEFSPTTVVRMTVSKLQLVDNKLIVTCSDGTSVEMTLLDSAIGTSGLAADSGIVKQLIDTKITNIVTKQKTGNSASVYFEFIKQ